MPKKKSKPKAVKPEIKEFQLLDLRPGDYNPRLISDEAFAGLAASMKRFGCVEPIIINTRTGENKIVGGHQRYRVLYDGLGPSGRVFCVTVDLSLADEKLLNITLNNPAIQGQFIERLSEYINELRSQLPEADLLQLRIDKLSKEVAGGEMLPYKEEKIRPFKKTHILLSFDPAVLIEIQNPLIKIIKTKGVEYEQSSN